MAITELFPALSVTCEALYIPFVDGVDVDNAPEFQQLVCDVIFKPNTKEDGVILVAGTAKGIIANTFTFLNVGDPAGTYPWPFDEQIVNLADTDLNPSGANYTVTIKPKGYVSATNTVVPLEGWADRVGILICEAGTNTTPLLQWMPLESASDGTAYLVGPPGPAGPTDVSVDAGNVATLGTDGKIFVPAGASVDATTAVKGVLKLAGDLAGTADLPTVPGLTTKVPTTRTITAGTGLTGGGDLSANRALAVNYGTTAGTAAQGNDSRLSDQRTPLDNSVTNAKVDAGAAISLDKTADSATRLAMTSAERTKLSAIAAGATANATDAQLRDRATHTGAQAISTITGLQTALDGKAATLGADDNYVTDAEKTKLSELSGTNTGDQDLSGYALLTAPGLLGRYAGVNAQTGTTYTPVLSDEGKLVTLTNAAAITVTLPQDLDLDFPIGARTDYAVLGAGMATYVAGTGATVNVADTAVSRKTNSSMTTVKIAANTWLVVGDLA